MNSYRSTLQLCYWGPISEGTSVTIHCLLSWSCSCIVILWW